MFYGLWLVINFIIYEPVPFAFNVCKPEPHIAHYLCNIIFGGCAKAVAKIPQIYGRYVVRSATIKGSGRIGLGYDTLNGVYIRLWGIVGIFFMFLFFHGQVI